MGKFFVAGVLLGGGVTWAAMHFLVQSGLRGEELKRHDEQIKVQAAARAREETTAELQKEFKAKTDELVLKYKQELDRRDESIKTLSAEKKELTLKLEALQEKLTLAEKSIERLNQRCADLSKIASQTSIASRELLKHRMNMRETQQALWRVLGESAAVLSQALVGWPDVELAQRASAELPKLAKDYESMAGTVRAYLEQHSKALADELGDLTPHRAGVQEADVREIKNLVDRIQKAVGRLRAFSTTVPAERDGWTETELFVEAGDIIHVRADGQWRMADNWEPSGPDGWDGGSQYKVAQNARVGSLILRIGVSERMHPAYLGRPITADASGRVMLRMNDNQMRDNAGELKVKVVSVNPKSLQEVVELWDRTVRSKK